MNYSTSSEFDRELKTLSKKWRSLPNDFKPVKKSLPLLYTIQPDETDENLRMRRDQFFNNKRATILHTTKDGIEIVKMRLDCASLGNKDMLRLVFVYIMQGDTITFIELYSKNDKQREDQVRIKKYL
jgi:hypothetical protein